MRYVAAFGRFWYDFIVGDSIVLAIGGLGALAAGAFAARSEMGALAEWLLPAVIIVTLTVSLSSGER